MTAHKKLNVTAILEERRLLLEERKTLVNLDYAETELEVLQTVKAMADTLEVPCDDIKPCVAYLWSNGEGKGSRNISAFILATEFRQFGFTEDKAFEELINWNNRLTDKIPPNRLKDRVNSAYKPCREGYKVKGGFKIYGCNGELSKYCYIGKEDCQYYKEHFSYNQKNIGSTDTDISGLVSQGWWKFLSLTEFRAYCAIVELETERQIIPGCSLICRQLLIARRGNISLPSITPALTSLCNRGLIRFEKGKRHLHYHRASKISRIVPIPTASKRKLNNLSGKLENLILNT